MRAVIEPIAQTERNNRHWMAIAFLAGMLFAAALAQNICAGGGYLNSLKTPSLGMPGDRSNLSPAALPDDGYTFDITYYRLVHACPGREAMLAI